MSRTLEIKALVTALSSVHHGGGQSIGINAKLRREKLIQPDRSSEEVPLISGNHIRGILRDRSMLHMCRALGYDLDEQIIDEQSAQINEGKDELSTRIAKRREIERAPDVARGLSLAAFYFLFSGGALTNDAGRALDIERARSLRRMIPLVGLFGGAVGNMIMPGKINVDKMVPICAETIHLLPEEYREPTPGSIWEYTQEEMYTRRDDEKNENLRGVLAPSVRGLLDGESASRRLLPANAPIQESTGAKQQMMYYVETLAAGTQFAWSIVLKDVTDTELEAFVVALAEFARVPYIGAKSGVGLGKIAIDFLGLFTVDNRLRGDTTALGIPAGENYFRHLRDRDEEIRDLLRDFA